MNKIYTKKCRLCCEEKPLDCFGPSKQHLSGKRCECYECRRKEYKEKDRDYQIKYHTERYHNVLKNDPIHKNKEKEYYQKNKEIIKQKHRDRYKNDENYRKEVLRKQSEYKKNNRPLVNARTKRYRQIDQVKIMDKIRLRLRRAIKAGGGKKSQSTEKYIGCSWFYLMAYLRATMDETMSWQFYKIGWLHADHIRPLCSFDLTKEEEIKKASHYTNLRLMWGTDNLSKAAKDKKLSVIRKT